MIVDLPQPEGPMNAVICFSGTRSENVKHGWRSAVANGELFGDEDRVVDCVIDHVMVRDCRCRSMRLPRGNGRQLAGDGWRGRLVAWIGGRIYVGHIANLTSQQWIIL